MTALRALQTAGGTLRRNPILFVVAAAFSLLQLPGLVAQSISPFFGSLVSLAFSGLLVFVLPFYFGGIIGMANEAIGGRTSFETLVQEGKSHYLSILVVYFGLLVFNVLLGIVGFLVVGVGAVVVFAAGVQPGLVAFALLGVVGLVFFLAYLSVLFVSQFFGHAIVIDDLPAIEGLKRSVWCVRNNLVSAFGYTVIVAVGGGVLGVLGGVFSVLTTPQFPQSTGVSAVGSTPVSPTSALGLPSVGLAGTIGLVVLLVVVSALFGGFFAAYSTAFYRSVRPS